MSPDAEGSLEDQLHELRARVHILEAALETHGIALKQQQKHAPAPAIQDHPLPPPLPAKERKTQEENIPTSSSVLFNLTKSRLPL